MFVKIQNTRLKVTSISEFTDKGYNDIAKAWSVQIVYRGKSRIFYFKELVDFILILGYLDKVLKVQEL